MTQPPGKINTGKINAAVLPVLTEVADANTADIPTLTEIHAPQQMAPQQMTFDVPAITTPESAVTPASEPLSDAACQYLAAQIAPQVDALLQEAVRDIKSRLPEIIRAALDNTPQE